MLFIILWLISPIVLLIMFLVQLSTCSELKRSNKFLSQQVNELLAQLAEKSAKSSADNKSDEPQPANIPQTETIPEQPKAVPSHIPPVYNVSAVTQSSVQPIHSESVAHIQKVDAYVNPEPAAPKKKISTINIILILGALFLSLSGFIFAAATWGVLNSFFKAVVLVSFSAIFFGIHSFTERKLKLEQTGRIFYILGSVFLPAAIIAAGLLEVFGHYLSFYGDGNLLVFAMVALSVCIPFFKGAYDYKNKFFAAVSHYSFSAAVAFVLLHVIPRADIAVLAIAIYSLLIVIAEPFIKGFYDETFGEDNVFSSQYSYFALISTTILGIFSNCVFLDDTFSVVTLIAFAIYSACFLTKSFTEKSGVFSPIAFASFITISLFSGFDPDNISGIACVIAATALIYATLSAMGLLPEFIRNIMKGFAIAAACIAGLFGVVENILYLADESVPSWEMVLASGVVFAEMLILAIRYKSKEFKGFTFAALIWFATDFVLLLELGMYGSLISFAIITAYFLVTRLSLLNNRLYSGANDIVFAVYTIVTSFCCLTDSELAAIAVLAVGIICTIISSHPKSSAVLCPILTFQFVIPIAMLLDIHSIILPYATDIGDSAMSIILILFCTIASVLLFIPKATRYVKSYGISVICLIPVFLISCMIWESADFVSMLAVCVYTAIFLAKQSFPKEKFEHINLLNAALLLTSVIAGYKFADDFYYHMFFPAVTIMLIFAVYALGEAFDTFSKVNPHTCSFIWGIAPLYSSYLFFVNNDADDTAIMIFGAILAICSAFASFKKKNTLNLILPILVLTFTFANIYSAEMLIVPFIVLVISGRVLFSDKLIKNLCIDVFSLGAYVPVIAYLAETYDDLREWTALLVLALLTLNLVRKEQTSNTKRTCITAAGVFMFPLFWTQPFFEVPELINVQFNLLPVFFFCLLVKLIWKDAAETADNFSFVAAIISLVILFMESFTSSDSFDAVFIGVVLFIMLAVSFIIKKKRWFVLAVASMVASGILLSFGQRDSIAWLVYLALAGAALIALGLANELKKQQQKTGEETKLSRFMSDWTW
ncbi:MAG: hypothetical protein J6K17_05545 [Oscillospiraceae bacterium]|nr:hypothetical protein [Oscillospiraceae bacterium]